MRQLIKVIAFDGLSGSGKTTLIKALGDYQGVGTVHKIIPIDRWTPSLWSFYRMNQQSVDLEYLSKSFVMNSVPFGIVWCVAPVNLCLERLKIKNDSSYENLWLMEELLEEYFEKVVSVPFLKIDTAQSLQLCVKQVMEWIEGV